MATNGRERERDKLGRHVISQSTSSSTSTPTSTHPPSSLGPSQPPPPSSSTATSFTPHPSPSSLSHPNLLTQHTQLLAAHTTLLAQNAQLWKLIEKQRTGYTQILKELERVRGERDGYKARLVGLGVEINDKEKDKDKGGKSRPSLDTSKPSALRQSSDDHLIQNRPSRSSDHHHLRTGTPPPSGGQPPQPQPQSQPQTVRPGRKSSLVDTVDGGRHFGVGGPLLSTSPPSLSSSPLSVRAQGGFSASASTIAPPTAPAAAPPSALLAPTQMHSRDSHISLPDEARTFIVNGLADSPAVTPNVSSFNKTRGGGTSDSEFLDLDGDDVSSFEEKDADADGEREADRTQQQRVEEDGGEEEEGQTASAITLDPGHSHSHPPSLRPGPSSSIAQPLPHPPLQGQLQPLGQGQGYSDAYGRDRSREDIHRYQQQMSGGHEEKSQPQGQPPPPPQSQGQPQPQGRPTTDRPLAVPASFRALPLLSSDLAHTTITVSQSFVRPNDRGKDVLSFIVSVSPGPSKPSWRVEKMYSDVLNLDSRVRNAVGRTVGKKMGVLPEGKLWKDHAPAKVDQRKAVLEGYLQGLVGLVGKGRKGDDEVIAFFTSDVVRESVKPVVQAGYKEGYLTKRGKNFGGWKTRFFVLQGPVLEYYDCRGGQHLGSITITGAQIARQHRSPSHPLPAASQHPPSSSGGSSHPPPVSDEEKEYRHAFLIVEARKSSGSGNHPRHVLCAESDEERDRWVEMLVRYYTGVYSDDLVFDGASGTTSVVSQGGGVGGAGRSSSSLGAQMEYARSSTPSLSLDPPPPHPMQNQMQRSGSEMGYHPPDAHAHAHLQAQTSRIRELQQAEMTVPSSSSTTTTTAAAAASGRSGSPDFGRQVKISGPMNGVALPSGFKFGKDALPGDGPGPVPVPASASASASAAPTPTATSNGSSIPPPAPIPLPLPSSASSTSTPNKPPISSSDRREKAKSRGFWGFGSSSKTSDKPSSSAQASRAVFGVPLEESLEVSQLCRLPAIVFRCIQYLEAKGAEMEEGIYRLSGSSMVIKNLKDRFNSEGDVDLMSSDEYWDPHAIAGLLKCFLRELPSSILTRELHLRFLSVIDFVSPSDRIRELSHLIALLPLSNYCLLRALTAHLILIVQNSPTNKMTMRNVGIVFSPTLSIPAGVFSLMLAEFNRVFGVESVGGGMQQVDLPRGVGVSGGGGGGGGGGGLTSPSEVEVLRRNSRQYTDAAADTVLGLAGRSLKPASSSVEDQSDDAEAEVSVDGDADGDGDADADGDGEISVDGDGEDDDVSMGSRTDYSQSQSHSPYEDDSGVGGGYGYGYGYGGEGVKTPLADAVFRVTPPDETSAASGAGGFAGGGLVMLPTGTQPQGAGGGGKASGVAASRGLNVNVTMSERGNRHSRIVVGLPASPRPGGA